MCIRDSRRRRPSHQLREDPSLGWGRVSQDRVERGDDRLVEGADEVEDAGAIFAAPDAVLVLNGDDIHVAVTERAGRPRVVGVHIPPDAMVDFGRVPLHLVGWLQRDNLVRPGKKKKKKKKKKHNTKK